MKPWGRELGLAVALLAVGGPVAATGQAPSAADPTFQLDFSNSGLSPSQWTLTLRPDGSGHFRSQAAKPTDDAKQDIVPPAVDRDIQVSAAYAGRVFAAAERHKWFKEPCESHLKVAFQGWKTLTYSGPQGQGSCTFNYSKDKEIENLGESLEAVAETILEGARMELLLQHDRLGLDAEMEFLVEAVDDGRAQQVCVIREILEQLAQDETVLERVRKRARMLLRQGST
ncbi:MAG TPA: hypothetical protein VJX73_16030 [Terracidiphilus sp.]|nr:hypothetical protein [Terracidiphilus sp.]